MPFLVVSLVWTNVNLVGFQGNANVVTDLKKILISFLCVIFLVFFINRS